MAKWRYAGPGPQPDDGGGIVRPGDVREFDTEPDWGPFEILDAPPYDPGPSQAPPEAPQTASPTQGPGLAAPSPAAASTAPPAPAPADTGSTGKGI